MGKNFEQSERPGHELELVLILTQPCDTKTDAAGRSVRERVRSAQVKSTRKGGFIKLIVVLGEAPRTRAKPRLQMDSGQRGIGMDMRLAAKKTRRRRAFPGCLLYWLHIYSTVVRCCFI